MRNKKIKNPAADIAKIRSAAQANGPSPFLAASLFFFFSFYLLFLSPLQSSSSFTLITGLTFGIIINGAGYPAPKTNQAYFNNAMNWISPPSFLFLLPLPFPPSFSFFYLLFLLFSCSSRYLSDQGMSDGVGSSHVAVVGGSHAVEPPRVAVYDPHQPHRHWLPTDW